MTGQDFIIQDRVFQYSDFRCEWGSEGRWMRTSEIWDQSANLYISVNKSGWMNVCIYEFTATYRHFRVQGNLTSATSILQKACEEKTVSLSVLHLSCHVSDFVWTKRS